MVRFTFSVGIFPSPFPLPFPFNPVLQAVSGLVLLNLLVTLGPRNKLLSPWRLGVFATCISGCPRTTEGTSTVTSHLVPVPPYP